MIYKQQKLNCILLLDSATRFGLREGTCNVPVNAKKDFFLVSFAVV